MAKTDAPPPKLRESLRYDPETGNFHHLRVTHKHGGLTKIGDIAGRIRDGYVVLTLDGITYPSHRIAWYLMTGDWLPSKQDIDHIDTNRSNNAWSNLRLVTRSQNIVNTSKQRSNNTSGKRGVYRRSDTFAWRADITFNGKTMQLGNFQTLSSAIEARKAAEMKYFGHYCGA